MNREYQIRKHERYPLFAPVQVSWVDRDGLEQIVTGKSADVSLYGMLLELPNSVPMQKEIAVRIDGVLLRAKARVRRCEEVFTWFRAGLEFDRTLLAEDLPLLNDVLIKSLRSANEEAQAKESTGAAKVLQIAARVRCLFTGHEFGWGSDDSGETTLTCFRCRAVLGSSAQLTHILDSVHMH